MADKLTPKQEAFVQGLFSGLSQREAYKKAGYKVDKMTDDQIDRDACVLAKAPKVYQRLKELQDAVAQRNIYTKEQLLGILVEAVDKAKDHLTTKKYFGSTAKVSEVVLDSSAVAVMTGAIAEINKMCGYHSPKKHEVTGGIDANVKAEIFNRLFRANKK